MGQVNEHYLDRVVAVAETATVEATEDILSGTGVKLIAKGGRIDARVRDRLLEHKLRKPLEMSVRVVDGVATRPIDRVAEALLGRHALLAGMCGSRTAKVVARALHDLRLTQPLESMLSLYAAQADNKLEHAVGVALLAAAMAEQLPEVGANAMQTLLLAGLLHDVGDLYIDPKILNAGQAVTAAQWRHIATHPVVASRVLRELPGGGPRVAEAVLHHHERLDGFGYPQGLAGAALPLVGQILGLAEVLMGIAESARSPGERAAVAAKLVPGEFDPRLRDKVIAAAVAARASDAAEGSLVPVDTQDLARRASGVAKALQGFKVVRTEWRQSIDGAGAGLRALADHVHGRAQRLQIAYSSTGLDAVGDGALEAELGQMQAAEHHEIALVLREVEWRLREVGREFEARSAVLPVAEQVLARRLVEVFNEAARRTGEPTAAA